MNCPICQRPTTVRDSRTEGDTVRRRRDCKQCRRRFSTVEVDAGRWDQVQDLLRLARRAHMAGTALAEALGRMGVQP